MLGNTSLDDLACRLGLEDARFLGEGVDAFTSRLGGHGLDGELGEAGENEHTTLLHLERTNGLESGHGEALVLVIPRRRRLPAWARRHGPCPRGLPSLWPRPIFCHKQKKMRKLRSIRDGEMAN